MSNIYKKHYEDFKKEGLIAVYLPMTGIVAIERAGGKTVATYGKKAVSQVNLLCTEKGCTEEEAVAYLYKNNKL